MWIAVDAEATRQRRIATALLSLLAVGIILALVAALVVTGRSTLPAAAGIGDPYYPGAGGSGYDVTSYHLDLTVDPESGRLDGVATVVLVPDAHLSELHLDLALPVTSVRLGANELTFAQVRDDLAISATPGIQSSGFERGTPLTLVIAYGGRPVDVDLGGEGAVYAGRGEVLIAGEPEGAAAWYPANDHPSDPALFSVAVTVPRGYQAVSVGRLLSHEATPSGAVWRWQTDEPTVTYATMLAVGHYDLAIETVRVGGLERQAVYAVSAAVEDRERAMRWLRRSPATADTLSRWLGPYPVSSIGGIVPAVKPWWGGLETLGRPLYHPSVVGGDALLAHELAHMWLGDTVTLERWDDLFINESLTSYAEWLAEEAMGRGSPQERFDELYRRSNDGFWRQRLSDPGTGRALFTRVYDRGAMAVHATRVAMGDDAFFRFFRAWAQQKGPHSLEQWRAQAQAASPADLQPLFAAWLDGTTRVPNRPELGFRQ